MGGVHSSNLMSDVTVLIVGDRNTEKYRFSVRSRSDVKFVRPEVISTIHSKWIKNEDKRDPNALNIDNYIMPTFDGFKICLSRINTDDQFDAADKFELVKFIQENGGEVSDSLTQSSTLVITNEKSGKRYISAKKWGIPSIHPLWVIHSVKRKAALEPNYYNIDKVEDQSKIGESSCLVWDDLRKRKRKRIITEEEEQIKKKPEIWKSIMDEAKKQASLPKKHDDAWDEPTIPNDIEKENINVDEVKQTNKRHNMTFMETNIDSKLFAGKTFKIEFFNQTKTNTLIKTIKSHSGIIIANDTDLLLDPPSYIIVPSDFPTTDLPSFFFELATTEVLTEFFIERCLHYRQIRLDTWGKPFYQPLINAPNLDVCITGFQGIELLHITKMLQLTPFKLHDYLTDERDLLIINYDILRSKTGEHLTKKYPSLFDESFKKTVSQASKVSTKRKLDFSRKNHIPILTIVFLFDSFYNGFVFNINGRDCCIHCPKLADLKPRLKELTLSDSERQTSIQDKNSPSSFPHSSPNSSSSSSSLPKLPSPVRNKRNDKWGRLVGRAPVSQLGKIELGPSLDKSPDVEDESFQSTQIGYGENLGDKLKSLLSGRDESIQDKSVTSEKRKRSTRQGYKEMMNILDNE